MTIQNPFLTSSYLSPEYFCNRVKETNALKNAALQSMNYALFSIRRLGKTALIHHLFHNLKKEKIKVVYLDISATNSVNSFVYSFSRAFFNQIANPVQKILNIASGLLKGFTPALTSDQLTGNISLELKLNKTEPVFDDLERLFDYIKNSDSQYLIAIDEFQQILNYPEKNFEAFLRTNLQFINNSGFIFSGSKKHLLLSIFGEYSKPLWQSCSFLELYPIEKAEYYEFITRKFADAEREIQPEALDTIFGVTRGITYFVQLACRNLFNTGIKKIDRKLAEETINNIVAERDSYYSNYINLLTKKQLELLTAISAEDGIDKPMGNEFLSKHNLGAATTIKSALNNLTDKEAIYKEKDNYFVADVFFAKWLKDNYYKKY